MVLIGAVAVLLVWIMMRVLAFLQPVLVPLAVAGIIAYLLEPMIRRLTARGWRRMRAMLTVYFSFHLVIIVLTTMVVVPAVRQANRWVEQKDAGDVIENVRSFLERGFVAIDDFWARRLAAVSRISEAATGNSDAEGEEADEEEAIDPSETETPEEAVVPPAAVPVPAPEGAPIAGATGLASEASDESAPLRSFSSKEWLQEHAQTLAKKLGSLAANSVTGFLGLFGYLVGLFLVPIYLYYFLKESESIQRTWSDYLPLKESRFKSEVVGTLNEINGYLIAFFRGQMLVSLIDGLLVGLCLMLIGLPGGLLIGIFVALLGLLPYIGSLMCWLPAIIISISYFGQTAPGPGGVPGANILDPATGEVLRHYVNTWRLFPHQIWVYPIIVTFIFVVVQQINSLVTQPRIVGDSVGLHPLTVIFSVLFWSLLIGGFLGVLLAVPLTAALKVLFRRYIWEKRIGRKEPEELPAEAEPTATA